MLISCLWGLVGGRAALGQEGRGTSPFEEGLQAYQDGRYEAAVPHLETALAADSLRPRVYAMLALSLSRTGRLGEAEAVLASGRQVVGGQPLLQMTRAELLRRKGHLAEALSVYQDLEKRQAQSRVSSGPMGPAFLSERIGRVHRELGVEAHAAGDTARAQSHLRRALRKAPSPGTYGDLGVLYLEQGRAHKALEMADSGLAEAPDTSEAAGRLLRLKASSLRRLGKTDPLADTYERLAALRPRDVEIQIGYGQALIRDGRQQAGIDHLRSLLGRFPSERRPYEALISLYDRYQNSERALQVLRQMRTRFPEDPEIVRRIADRLGALGRLGDAKATYDTLQTQTGNVAAAARARAEIYEAEGRYGRAAEEYRRALQEGPAQEPLFRDLGRAIEKDGRWLAALDIYERWVGQSREPGPHVHRGRAFQHLGRLDSARLAYERALGREASHPLPAARLATLLWQEGRPDAAFDRAVEAIRLGLSGKPPRQMPAGRVDTSAFDGEGVPSARQRRRQRASRWWRQSVDEAFAHLTRRYPRDRVDPALTKLQDAFPGAARLHLLLSRYYEDAGRSRAARRAASRAVELEPGVPETHRARARASVALGDTAAAISAYRRAFALDRTDRESVSALIDLREGQGRLETLIRRWRRRYGTRPSQPLREALIEALHKAGRYGEAQKIAQAAAADSTAAKP